MGYLNFRRSFLNRVLRRACKKNKLGLVKFLIFWGANKDVKFEVGDTQNKESLIQIAYENGALDIAKYLIDKVSSIDNIEIERACNFGNLEIVESLLKRPDAVLNINKKNQEGRTPLMVACCYGREDIARYLLKLKDDKGIDLDIVDNCGCNALMFACRQGDFAVVRDLLKNGARLTSISRGRKSLIKDYRGYTPLTYLFDTYKDRDVEKIIDCLLKDNKKMLNDRDGYGKTVLMHAVDSHNVAGVKYLIKKGINLKDKDETENNALHHAVNNKDYNMVKCLVDGGIDLNNLNALGKTPLMCAVKNEDINVVRYLVNHGANINIMDNFHCNALIYAIKNRDYDIVNYLVNEGADIYIKFESKTSLMYAIECGDRKIVQTLINAHFGKGNRKDDEYLTYKDKNNDNALVYAFYKNDFELIDSLLDYDIYDIDMARTNEERIEEVVGSFLDMDKSFEPGSMDEICQREDFEDFFDYLKERNIKLSKDNIIQIIEFLQEDIMDVSDNTEFSYKNLMDYLLGEKVISDKLQFREEFLSDYLQSEGATLHPGKIKDFVDFLLYINKNLKDNEMLCDYDELSDYLNEKSKMRKLLNFLMDTNECILKLNTPPEKYELMYEYKDLIELFDSLKKQGIVLNKNKILKCIGEREDVVIDYILSDNKILQNKFRKQIKDIYKVIKNNNRNMRELEKMKIQESHVPLEAGRMYSESYKLSMMPKRKGFWKKTISKIMFVLRFPFVSIRKLFNSLLLKACKKNSKFMAKVALFFGADVNMKDQRVNFALKAVCENKNLDMLSLLIDSGLDLKREDLNSATPLCYAIDEGDLSIVRDIINRLGVDYVLHYKNSKDVTYLMHACYRESVEIIKEFIKLGLDVNRENEDGLRPIECAAKNIDALRCLIDHGAYLNKKNRFGESMIENIMRNPLTDKDVLLLLISRGACVNEEQKNNIINLIFEEKLNEFGFQDKSIKDILGSQKDQDELRNLEGEYKKKDKGKGREV